MYVHVNNLRRLAIIQRQFDTIGKTAILNHFFLQSVFVHVDAIIKPLWLVASVV